MGARRHKRRRLCTEVRIFGTDAHGHPFARLAETVDVSISGARLSGVFLDLRVGDEINLQSDSGHARYQVVWQGQIGTAHGGEVALRVVEPSSTLWPDDELDWTDSFHAPTSNTPGDRKVLVVDDSLTARNMAAHYLRRHGYSVMLAKNGPEALDAVKSCRPDLILLDMLMPRMSGLAVLRRLKTNTDTREIPVVVVSSLSETNNARLMAEGACGYIAKNQTPPHQLPAFIDRVLRTPPEHRVYDAESS